MKEYIESMKDSRDPFSGETYLLPEELAKKYADAEALEIEYLTYKQSGMIHPDELKEIRDEAVTAIEQYREALLKKMPSDIQEAYHMKLMEDKTANLMKKFHSAEGNEAQPLFVDATIQWKDDQVLEHRTFCLNEDYDDGRVFFNCKDLNDMLSYTKPDNGEDFVILNIEDIYGKSYNIAVVEYLTRDVSIEAKTEKDAMDLLDRQYTYEEIVLDSEDFKMRDVMEKDACIYRPEQVKLTAAPENTYTFTIQEILEKDITVNAANLKEAIQDVEKMLRHSLITLSADDYVETNYITHGRVIDNSLHEPVNIPLNTSQSLQAALDRLYPEGVTVTLQPESVEHLKTLSTTKDFNGLIDDSENTLLASFGNLHAEARLVPDDYDYVYADENTYHHEKMAETYDQDTAASTLFMYLNPEMKGGRVNLHAHPQIMKRIFIEDIPLQDVIQAIKDKDIKNEEDVVRLRNEIKSRERITEVSLYKNMLGSTLIRCKIDGAQQSGKKIPLAYKTRFDRGDLTKTALASKVFSEELKQQINREENRGMKR